MTYPNLMIILFAFATLAGACCDDDGVGSTECPCFDESYQHPIYRACDPIVDLQEASQCAQGELLQDVYSATNYPLEARQDSIEGRIVVVFEIYKDGSVGEFRVENDTIGYGLAEAAIEGATILAEKGFCPALNMCVPEQFTFYLPISFRL